jgi:hypothetical protein
MNKSSHVYSNATSGDVPTYFNNKYVSVRQVSPHSIGKRIFPVPVAKDLLSPKADSQNPSKNHLRLTPNLDQDLDSLRLSVQPDITRGYKNTLRYKSNHHQLFFNNVENAGYNRLSTEITCLYKLPKILRTLKTYTEARTKSTSLHRKFNGANCGLRGNELSYLLELKSSASRKKTLPKMIRGVSPTSEIDVFENKLRESSLEQKRSMYNLLDNRRRGG